MVPDDQLVTSSTNLSQLSNNELEYNALAALNKYKIKPYKLPQKINPSNVIVDVETDFGVQHEHVVIFSENDNVVVQTSNLTGNPQRVKMSKEVYSKLTGQHDNSSKDFVEWHSLPLSDPRSAAFDLYLKDKYSPMFEPVSDPKGKEEVVKDQEVVMPKNEIEKISKVVRQNKSSNMINPKIDQQTKTQNFNSAPRKKRFQKEGSRVARNNMLMNRALEEAHQKRIGEEDIERENEQEQVKGGNKKTKEDREGGVNDVIKRYMQRNEMIYKYGSQCRNDMGKPIAFDKGAAIYIDDTTEWPEFITERILYRDTHYDFWFKHRLLSENAIQSPSDLMEDMLPDPDVYMRSNFQWYSAYQGYGLKWHDSVKSVYYHVPNAYTKDHDHYEVDYLNPNQENTYGYLLYDSIRLDWQNALCKWIGSKYDRQRLWSTPTAFVWEDVAEGCITLGSFPRKVIDTSNDCLQTTVNSMQFWTSTSHNNLKSWKVPSTVMPGIGNYRDLRMRESVMPAAVKGKTDWRAWLTPSYQIDMRSWFLANVLWVFLYMIALLAAIPVMHFVLWYFLNKLMPNVEAPWYVNPFGFWDIPGPLERENFWYATVVNFAVCVGLAIALYLEIWLSLRTQIPQVVSQTRLWYRQRIGFWSIIVDVVVEEILVRIHPLAWVGLALFESWEYSEVGFGFAVHFVMHWLLTWFGFAHAVIVHVLYNLAVHATEGRSWLPMLRALSPWQPWDLQYNLFTSAVSDVPFSVSKMRYPYQEDLNGKFHEVDVETRAHLTKKLHIEYAHSEEEKFVVILGLAEFPFIQMSNCKNNILFMIKTRLIGASPPVLKFELDRLKWFEHQYMKPSFPFLGNDAVALHACVNYYLLFKFDEKSQTHRLKVDTRNVMFPKYLELWFNHLSSAKKKEYRRYYEMALSDKRKLSDLTPKEIRWKLTVKIDETVKCINEFDQLACKPRPLFSINPEVMIKLAPWSWISKVALVYNFYPFCTLGIGMTPPLVARGIEGIEVASKIGFLLCNNPVEIANWVLHNVIQIFNYAEYQFHDQNNVTEEKILKALNRRIFNKADLKSADLAFHTKDYEMNQDFHQKYSNNPKEVTQFEKNSVHSVKANTRCGIKVTTHNFNPTGNHKTTDNNTISIARKTGLSLIESIQLKNNVTEPEMALGQVGDDTIAISRWFENCSSEDLARLCLEKGMSVKADFVNYSNVDFLGARLIPAVHLPSGMFVLCAVPLRPWKWGTMYSSTGKLNPYSIGRRNAQIWLQITIADPVLNAWARLLYRICQDHEISTDPMEANNPFMVWDDPICLNYYQNLGPHVAYWEYMMERYGLSELECREGITALDEAPPACQYVSSRILAVMARTDCL
jgi:hypothetical protein